MATHDLREKALILHPDDDVVIAKAPIAVGTVLEHGGERIEVQCDIRPGHKVARRARAQGEAVRRYGQVIGFATQPIAQGEHIHTHNLAVGDYQREYEIGVDVRPVDYYPAERMRHLTFSAIQARAEVGCSRLDLATVAQARGNRDAAASHLSEAYLVFRSLGVPKYEARATELAGQFEVPLPGLGAETGGAGRPAPSPRPVVSS